MHLSIFSGIALQLGGAGATVYITGRTLANLEECAAEIKVLMCSRVQELVGPSCVVKKRS